MDGQKSIQVEDGKIGESLSVWLDAFRWVAAFAVLLSHVRHRVFAPFPSVPTGDRSISFYVLSTVSSFGPPAVIIFFVLSGFLVGGSSLRRYRKSGDFLFGDYIQARLSRLWIVLIPVFMLTFVLNMLGMFTFRGVEVGVYAQLGTFYTNDLFTLICNIGFLQTAACYQYGQNGALWSLFNEFWYYVAWPPMMLALCSRLPISQRIGLLAIPVIILVPLAWFQFVGPNIAAYFVLWLLGVVASTFRNPIMPMRIHFAAMLFLSSLAVWRVIAKSEVQGANFLHEFPIDLIIAVSFANLIMNMKVQKYLPFPPLRRLHQPLANFSFTLYCTHTPIINCCCAFLVWGIGVGWHMMPIGPTPFILYVWITLLCLGSAFLLSRITENKTAQVRSYIHAQFAQMRIRMKYKRNA